MNKIIKIILVFILCTVLTTFIIFAVGCMDGNVSLNMESDDQPKVSLGIWYTDYDTGQVICRNNQSSTIIVYPVMYHNYTVYWSEENGYYYYDKYDDIIHITKSDIINH